MLALRVFAAFLLALPVAGLAMTGYDLARGVAPYPDGILGTGYWAAASSGEVAREGRVPRTTTARVDPDVSFARTPSFVTPVEPMDPAEWAEEPSGGFQFLLFDQQVDATGRELVSYSRFVVRTVNETGVAAVSTFPIQIDPALQSLELHEIAVDRDGTIIDLTETASVDFLRSENELSQGIYSGSVTALVRVPGLHAGDVADISYTVRQRHPIVGNRHTALYDFGFNRALERVHYRSIWPRGQVNFTVVGAGAEIEQIDTGRQTILSFGPGPLNLTKSTVYIPPWQHASGIFIGTRFESWQDVAEWAAPLYSPIVDDDVEAIAAEIMAAHADRGDRIAEALRYVQREVRYFAILFGEGGYQPLTPAETLRYGEGDCKAKTLLLLSILSAMDIEAHAALVHLSVGRGIIDLPATPHLFDHVLVAVEHEGQRYYLDGTRAEQAGTLDRIFQMGLGYALVLEDGADELVQMPEPVFDAPFVDVNEQFDLTGLDRGETAAMLEAEWVFRGASADQVRALINQQGERAILQTMATIYTARVAAWADDATGSFSDDRDANILTYRWASPVEMTDFAVEDSEMPTYVIAAHAPAAIILPAELNNRTWSMVLPYPYFVRQTTSVTVPEGHENWLPEPDGYASEMPAFTLSSNIEIDGRRAVMQAVTQVRQAELAPEDFEAARDALALGHYEARVILIGEQENFVMDDAAINAYFANSYVPYVPEEDGAADG
jgi:Domain of Unknown Function with PDB structure (DUF3857)